MDKREKLLEEVLSYVKSEDILNYYDREIEERVKEAIIFSFNDLKINSKGDAFLIPKDWKDYVILYADMVTEMYSNSLKKWALKNNFKPIDIYLKNIGKVEVESWKDIYNLIEDAQFFCIEKIIKAAIEVSIDKGIIETK